MVAQLKPPQAAARLPWLLPPAMPPRHQLHAYGYRLRTDGSHVLSDVAAEVGPAAQRIVAAYLLRFRTREELAEMYGLSARQVQEIVSGTARHYLTAPVFQRLRDLGIDSSVGRSHRGDALARMREIRDAQSAVASRAAEAMRFPERFTPQEREKVERDLYLLSGSWLGDVG